MLLISIVLIAVLLNVSEFVSYAVLCRINCGQIPKLITSCVREGRTNCGLGSSEGFKNSGHIIITTWYHRRISSGDTTGRITGSSPKNMFLFRVFLVTIYERSICVYPIYVAKYFNIFLHRKPNYRIDFVTNKNCSLMFVITSMDSKVTCISLTHRGRKRCSDICTSPMNNCVEFMINHWLSNLVYYHLVSTPCE